MNTFGKTEAAIRLEAFIGGDKFLLNRVGSFLSQSVLKFQKIKKICHKEDAALCNEMLFFYYDSRVKLVKTGVIEFPEEIKTWVLNLLHVSYKKILHN